MKVIIKKTVDTSGQKQRVVLIKQETVYQPPNRSAVERLKQKLMGGNCEAKKENRT